MIDMSRKNLTGWWEEYKCGCVSPVERYKKDLCGYCPKHGQDRRNVYPEFKPARRAGKKA